MSALPLQRDSGANPLALLCLAALLSAIAPSLLAYNLPPSATALNQCLAVVLWAGWALMLKPGPGLRATAWLQAALIIVALGVLASWLVGTLPAAMAVSALGLLIGASLLAWAGATAARQADGTRLFGYFAIALTAAGLLSAVVAVIQVFLPQWADGTLIAQSGIVGRAVGNTRQPNHLCSLLLWAAIGVAALSDLGLLRRGLAIGAMLLLVLAVELSASRTGAIGLILLAGWGALDRRLSRFTRFLLVATPLMYAAAFIALQAWSSWSEQAIGAGARIAGESTAIESPNSRWRIWANTLTLIRLYPWLGVGFGEFNAAWSLTPFPGRPTAFFDHTHTLPLQLAVELGVPTAALVMALVFVALWRAWQRGSRAEGTKAHAGRAAWMLVVLIGLHSLFEYPLWYSYFLLPAAFAWGYALGVPTTDTTTEREFNTGRSGMLLALLMIIGGCTAMVDYLRVSVIYAPREGSGSLSDRIATGQRSVFFAPHADYAAATSAEPMPGRALAFARAPHYLLDTRLMIAWARYLAEQGQRDKARALAERIREFRNPDSTEFFEPCTQPIADAFQCETPSHEYVWREFLARPSPSGSSR